MVNHEVLAQYHLTRQFNAGDDLDELVQDLVDEREELAQQGWAYTVAPAAKAVHHQCQEALGTPVAPMGGKIGADVVKHLSKRYVNSLIKSLR